MADIATMKTDIESNLTTAWDVAQKIVHPAQRRWVTTLIASARESLSKGWSDKPQELKTLGREMNDILFAAFQAGMNVTDIDDKKDDAAPHEIDHDKSIELFGILNAAIFKAKAGACDLRLIPAS